MVTLKQNVRRGGDVGQEERDEKSVEDITNVVVSDDEPRNNMARVDVQGGNNAETKWDAMVSGVEHFVSSQVMVKAA